MKILITGGAGFIGSNVAAHYLQKGHSVTLYDNLSRANVQHNLSWLSSTFPKSRQRLVQADVQNSSKLTPEVKKHSLIFHFAGQTAVTTSIHNPALDFTSNALGTFTLLEAIRLHHPQAIVLYSSTNKVYGSLPHITTRVRGSRYVPTNITSINESTPLDFHSPYGCSKGIGDQYMIDFARVYDLNTIVFRQSCIYGIHQFGVEDQGWVAHFTAQAITNQPITIFGNGKQVRDLLFITDLVRAMDQAVSKIHRTRGHAYNIGGGANHTISLLELIKKLEQLSGHPLKIRKAPTRKGDQNVVIMNTDRAFQDFNWRPTVTIPEGLHQLYHWLSAFLTTSA